MAGPQTRNVVPAPGAMVSPQGPGMTPDRTIVPGHVGFEHPPAQTKRRPLSQYGSAEEIMGVFRRKPADQLEAADFEQAGASDEEMRSANPALLTPVRPLERHPSRAAQLEGGEEVRELQSENTPENAAHQVGSGKSVLGATTTGETGVSPTANPQGATQR